MKRPRGDTHGDDCCEDDRRKPHIEWASLIKAHHQKIRDLAIEVGSAESAWDSVVQDKASLKQYSTAMHHLATQYWDTAVNPLCHVPSTDRVPATSDAGVASSCPMPTSNTSRYDDRVAYALRCIQEYFIGPVAGNGSSDEPEMLQHSKKFVPYAVSHSLKQKKRSFFESHRRQMTDEELDNCIREWLCIDASDAPRNAPMMNRLPKETSLPAVRYFFAKLHGIEQWSYEVRLRVLDVGSCYGPFEGKHVLCYSPVSAKDVATATGHNASLQASECCLDVVSLDLAPYEGSSVLQCDWLSVPILECDDEHPEMIVTSSSSVSPDCDGLSSLPPPAVTRIAASSFDVIIFSLVLSYLPSTEMRFEAIAQAHKALREYGLLIVISTRTQGPRSAKWIDDWIGAIESIGFERIHKTIQCKLIGMSFQKVRKASDAVAEARRMKARQSMTITADLL